MCICAKKVLDAQRFLGRFVSLLRHFFDGFFRTGFGFLCAFPSTLQVKYALLLKVG